MEKTEADGQPPKPDGDREQPRSLPYSLETPYGFHLDLDFLKYVDDIEKGNTIRRVHIHRRAKQPKFNTLPRNFSLPESGSRGCSTAAPSKSWTSTCSFPQRKASLGEEPPRALLPAGAAPEEPSYRRKALLAEARRQAELGWPQAELGWPQAELARPQDALRARPQLLRASSMPEALPPGHSPPAAPSPLRSPPQPCRGPQSASRPSSEGSGSAPPREMERDGSAGQPGGALPLQPPWQSQQLQVLVESGAEEGDAADGSDLARAEAAAPAALRLAEESVSPAERGLSVSEMDLNVLKESEERNVRAGGDKESSAPRTPEHGEPGGVTALKQQVAELEEQLAKKKEELEQVRAVLEQQDREIQEKEKSIKLLASSKAELEEQLWQEKAREAEPRRRRGSGALQRLDAAVNTELSQGTGLRQAQDKGINVNIPLSTRSIGCGTLRAESAQAGEACREQGPAGARAQGRAGEASVEAGPPAPCLRQLQIHEHPGDHNQNHQNSLGKAGFGEDEPREGLQEEGAPGHEELPAVDPIGQYVKKIQELLQEQWLCLEHGYPELASAIKQPASKLSSIQNQLVNSLNSLLSAYSSQGPVDKENSNTHYQQLENSPTTSLKSIMKKKGCGFHAGGNGTKKNLQFVGVNGGYETTSSEEDTSCEDSDTETEDRAGDVEPEQDGRESRGPSSGEKREEEDDDDDEQEASAGAAPCSQHQAHRCKPSEDFLAACQLLSEHLPEISSRSNQHLQPVLGSISREWFQVSSHKASRPEVVAAYLEALGDIQPQLLETVVNLPDRNGNTALHYSVSHSNFQVAKLLLDTGKCCLDLQNRAGYTAVMLTPLAAPETRQDMEVVMRLLQEGDVNLRAAQGGQTALMLGVSHDRDDMVRALLACRADVNLQDEEGSTALMVACRQGNADMVRLLLAQPGCLVTLTDKGGNSAVSLAHGDIAALLRAHIELSPSLPL
ncbi:KN motif and ankyrin repeat domain-containing protein 4 isoform X1 [Ammospiza nelsoni]|uniref:KN motif and ankyrin repeat domain-containing protein 4 isoform X1 n=1 Tax=Ammospiza nelsoni TaxID=2857394 RepID=UPI00286BF0EE|nr:KN motif and ankyrin repeat domain-containing protein 4 isoform X1 [Ammospiza nelsoni]XP_059334764.1 KN motif and ankyrin repeat domain-containing protein 4 isoform X1 [Ammospiza nelsoni]